RLPQFEGPFDLLLFFIERDELDIYNIPISQITDDFLRYIHHLESLDVDLASEFILVAAQLMSIKARMLLPRKQIDETGREIDPRQELVDRLLEYKRYKDVLDEMRQLEEDRQFRSARGFASEELRQLATKALVDVELESLSLFRLLQAFEKVMQRFEENRRKQAVHQVVRWPYTIRDQQQYILSLLMPGVKVGFEDLFRDCENRIHAIVTFLALLELLNQQALQIAGGEGMNRFWLSANEEGDDTPDLREDELTDSEPHDVDGDSLGEEE
ncbi:MAG: segregation/condensation protein A, partial [Saprospiraceae bacterium]|nr:segregation/condensation protein A [Saprospiraceae bacterium]